MISKEERAELRKKLSDASHSFPLPWRTGDYEEVIDANGHEVAECVERHHTGDSAERCIADAVNAMPVILDALDAADERISVLESEQAKWQRIASIDGSDRRVFVIDRDARCSVFYWSEDDESLTDDNGYSPWKHPKKESGLFWMDIPDLPEEGR